MKRYKNTFRTTHVKQYDITNLKYDSSRPIIDKTSNRDGIHLCYADNENDDDQLSFPFAHSHLKEFKKLMKRGILCIVPRSDAKGYCINDASWEEEIKNVEILSLIHI